MTDKLDLKKSLDGYRARSGEFRIVDVAPMTYLMIDGHGDPNTAPRFSQAVETLFPVAYALKFASKRELGRDYAVMPLEGLWWSDDHAAYTTDRDTSRWDWTLMVLTPDWIGRDLYDAAVAKTATKSPPLLDELRLETLDEGRCVQTLHVGPFDAEGPVLARMHEEFIPGSGLRMRGKHHEIYFSDLRRTAPEKLRTILRQPVEEA